VPVGQLNPESLDIAVDFGESVYAIFSRNYYAVVRNIQERLGARASMLGRCLKEGAGKFKRITSS